MNIKSSLIASLLLTCSVASAEVKIVLGGTPQAGPAMVITNAVKNYLDTPSTIVSHNNCRDQNNFVTASEDVVYITGNMRIAAHQAQNEECLPKFSHQDVIGSFISGFHLCRATGGKDIRSSQRITVGGPLGVGTEKFVADLNQQNNLSLAFVPVSNSAQIITMLQSRNIDWGFVMPGAIEPQLNKGQIDCPYTVLKNGSSVIPASSYIRNHFKMSIPVDPISTWIIVMKTSDPAKRLQATQALDGREFREWLNNYRLFEIRLGINENSQNIHDNWFSRLDDLKKYLINP